VAVVPDGITDAPLVQVIAVGLPAGLVVHATGAGTPGFAAGDVIDETPVNE
jgi:hypothetical protein